MSRDNISKKVKRKLYAESMGKCMNPNCQIDLFGLNGDIIEKAHIDPYCKTADNSFENLVILCPNCHTNFDKNSAFTPEEVLEWKKIRQDDIERLFCKKYDCFEDLQNDVVPLLEENKSIYENYYLGDNKHLWDRFEKKVLINNRKIKELIKNNLNLFQRHNNPDYSNQSVIRTFLQHIDEFEATRYDDEKIRSVLYPSEVDSIFGIKPIEDNMLPSTESLEKLITKLDEEGKFFGIRFDEDPPYIVIKQSDEKQEFLFLTDTPRLRQLYHDYDCFSKAGVRLDSLSFALKHICRNGFTIHFISKDNLRQIVINKTKIYFVYEYCLSEASLRTLYPEEHSIVINLHNWNGECCISEAAYSFAKRINVTLFTSEKFYEYIKSIKNSQWRFGLL